MSNGGRNFSFEPQDDHQQASQQPPPQSYQAFQPQQQYHEPPQDFASPPPSYQATPYNISQQPPSPTSPRRIPVAPDTHLLGGDLSPPQGALSRQPAPLDHDDFGAPPPPPHRSNPNPVSRDDSPYRPYSDVTTGMDNYGDGAAGGGVGSVAQGVADRHPRESGLQAARSIPPPFSPYQQSQSQSQSPSPYQQPPPISRGSYGSSFALAQGAATPGRASPAPSRGPRSSAYSGRSIPLDDYHSNSSQMYSSYHDLPYQQSPSHPASVMNQAAIDPHNILDDGDDEFPTPHRSGPKGPAAAGAAGAGGTLGGIFGRNAKSPSASGSYDPVTGPTKQERSAWAVEESKRKRRKRLLIGVGIGAIIIIAIVAGIVGGLLGNKNSDGGSSSGSDNNAAGDTAANGDLGKDSAEIKALMNNDNLHKVFPGMDYTPWGTQYPLCMTYPPSQNNVTRDMAVLSQLTNVVRLYGTDCNQTEMVLHAIDRLELTDMKVWMGVWIDTNQTTTDRQIDQMYKILANTQDQSIYKGVIIGNEALYRAGEDKAQSEAELINYLTNARNNFTTLGYDLPIATSDLGDNWNAQLVQVVDYVMSNIHPFFAGVTPDVAAGWTWDFWQSHDVILTESTPKVKQLISETGWPSGGGEDCGGTDGSCSPGQSGAIAGVEEMNTFMEEWVCQALSNGTEYFWFEAFDEPWKVVYNQGVQNWEDKWGLMDPGRNLKDGLKIPDCGGNTVGS